MFALDSLVIIILIIIFIFHLEKSTISLEDKDFLTNNPPDKFIEKKINYSLTDLENTIKNQQDYYKQLTNITLVNDKQEISNLNIKIVTAENQLKDLKSEFDNLTKKLI